MSKITHGRNPAFTLIELLVVVAIIALLLSIMMPAIIKVKSSAQQIRCAANLKQINLALGLYLNDYQDFYPCAQDPVSTSPFYWLWMGRGWRSFVGPYLSKDIDPNNPSVLFCPQDRTAKENYESTSYSYSMSFYHSPEQIDQMDDTSDTWSNPMPSVPQSINTVEYPDRKIIIGEWLSNHLNIENDGGWWCWDGSRNYLFADGHVDYIKAEDLNKARDNYPDANLTLKGIKGKDFDSITNHENEDVKP